MVKKKTILTILPAHSSSISFINILSPYLEKYSLFTLFPQYLFLVKYSADLFIYFCCFLQKSEYLEGLFEDSIRSFALSSGQVNRATLIHKLFFSSVASA